MGVGSEGRRQVGDESQRERDIQVGSSGVPVKRPSPAFSDLRQADDHIADVPLPSPLLFVQPRVTASTSWNVYRAMQY